MVYGTYTVTIVSGAYKLTYNWGASHCIFLCAMFNSYVYVTNYQTVRCFCVFPNGQWDGSREHLHRKPRIFPGNMGGLPVNFPFNRSIEMDWNGTSTGTEQPATEPAGLQSWVNSMTISLYKFQVSNCSIFTPHRYFTIYFHMGFFRVSVGFI